MDAIIKKMNSEDKQERMKAVEDFMSQGYGDDEENLSVAMKESDYEDVLFELLKRVAELKCSLTVSGDIERNIEIAISNILDQSKLIELANISPCADEIVFAVIATEYITDKKVLADLAKKVEFGWADVDFIEEFGITDMDSLIDIAKNAKESLVAESAVGGLKYIMEHENPSEDFNAIFADIAKTTDHEEVRLKAGLIHDKEILKDILKDMISPIVREEIENLISLD